jgi:galactokinase
MYSAFEIASNKKMSIINEQILDETLRKIYPGLKIKGSLVDISISDFIKIKNHIDSSREIKKEIVNSLRGLINYLHKHNIKCKYEYYLPIEEAVNIIYKDHSGSTSQITMLLNDSNLTKMGSTLFHNHETKADDFNYPKITNNTNDSISINLDRTKIIDLLYVHDKINRNIHTMADNNKIFLLAKSINLY